MTTQNSFISKAFQSAFAAKPILVGAVGGLLLITFFLSGINDPNPEWGRFWMLKPLVMVSLAGACGGAIYSVLELLRRQGNISRAVVVVAGFYLYAIGLFLGTVLGLDGTLWN